MRVFLFVTFTAISLCSSSPKNLFVYNFTNINKTYSFTLYFYLSFIGNTALDWIHSMVRAMGFRLASVDDRLHFHLSWTLYRGLPNWLETFLLLSQQCFQKPF